MENDVPVQTDKNTSAARVFFDTQSCHDRIAVPIPLGHVLADIEELYIQVATPIQIIKWLGYVYGF